MDDKLFPAGYPTRNLVWFAAKIGNPISAHVEDYEYYHAQEAEDTIPPERIRSAYSVEYFEAKIHAQNHSREWLEHQLARALYVLHQRNFRESLD